MSRNHNNYAFIDNQNLNRGTRSEGWRVDWFKFRQFLADRFDVGQAYMFIGYLDEYQPMYEQLTGYGFTVIFKPTTEIKDQQQATITKGNVDVELVLQVMQDYDRYHQAVIVSADGDFYSLIKYLAQTNKLKRLLIPSSKYSNLFQEFQNLITHLSQHQKDLTHQPVRPRTLLAGEKRARRQAKSAKNKSQPRAQPAASPAARSATGSGRQGRSATDSKRPRSGS